MQAALAEAEAAQEAALALQQGRCAELEAEVSRLGECNLNLNQELETEVLRLGTALSESEHERAQLKDEGRKSEALAVALRTALPRALVVQLAEAHASLEKELMLRTALSAQLAEAHASLET